MGGLYELSLYYTAVSQKEGKCLMACIGWTAGTTAHFSYKTPLNSLRHQSGPNRHVL
jgi:hypothetical protein